MKCQKKSIKKLTEKSAEFPFWSINEIQSLVDIPKKTKHNWVLLWNLIGGSLIKEICLHSREQLPKRGHIHLDDACSPNLTQSAEYFLLTKVKQMLHTVYSPDQEPFNFFPFDYLKNDISNMRSRTRRA
jgi:hypothetical protein